MLRSLIPRAFRRRARLWHREHVLRRACARVRQAVRSRSGIPDELLDQLSYGWSNEGWAAKPALLRALLQELDRPVSSVLECGTGLSSLLIALHREDRGFSHLALEHDRQWHDLVRHRFDTLEMDSSCLQLAPLVTHGDYAWYGLENLPGARGPFDLVLCDGPPAATFGGRSGLLPSVSRYMKKGARIIVDDMVRDDEARMVASWLATSEGQLSIAETGRYHVVLVLS